MIGYATLGTNDLDRARAYYDALLGEIGGKRLMEFPQNGFTLYGTGFGKPGIAVTRPYDGEPATVGNGNMIALVMDSRERVDSFYAKAIELGGTDEGPPGVRGPEGDRAFYGAYFRDPDGHKLCAFRIGPA
ncbi:VOC family protein [Allosphingosinicella sp.]|jgi:catechol 2,3-dioxygenase-like lactoylglutathione lyase family enzyme|uniref:VOC family protein n=1 Tax=Allosphingosinicella sp. TaxID=2823234 RepID=UPI002EEC6F92